MLCKSKYTVILPAHGDICSVCSEDFRHNCAARGSEGEAAAHWTAAGRERPGERWGREGNQPRRGGAAGAVSAEERAGSGKIHVCPVVLTHTYLCLFHAIQSEEFLKSEWLWSQQTWLGMTMLLLVSWMCDEAAVVKHNRNHNCTYLYVCVVCFWVSMPWRWRQSLISCVCWWKQQIETKWSCSTSWRRRKGKVVQLNLQPAHDTVYGY